jgi:hypothetical protein
VATATKLLHAIAALYVIGIVLSLTVGLSSIRSRFESSGVVADSRAISIATTVAIVTAVVFGLIAAALFVLTGVFVGRGRSWARILAFVLCGLTVLSGLTSLTRFSVASTASLLELLAAVGVVVLLARRESGAFFAAARPRLAEPGYPSYPPQQ